MKHTCNGSHDQYLYIDRVVVTVKYLIRTAITGLQQFRHLMSISQSPPHMSSIYICLAFEKIILQTCGSQEAARYKSEYNKNIFLHVQISI